MGGSGNDTLIGSSGANRLMGGIGSDSVSGGIGDDWITGNSGQDTLGGGQGKDWFVFTSSGASNADHVLDYSVADDTIILDHVAMKKLPFGPGTLASTYFRAGPVAKEADDFLIYDKATGKLFYDADGNGIAAPALIATFDNHPSITASEIMVKFSTSPEGFWYYVA